jgi:uncharacterized lipoprotein YajG
MVGKHAMLAILIATVSLAACDKPANPPQPSANTMPAPTASSAMPSDAGSAVAPAPMASQAK